MACEQHHLAAARHVAAAYHHFQAIAQEEKGNHVEFKSHADSAHNAGKAALKYSTSAMEHSADGLV